MKNTLLHLSGRLKSVAVVGALAICAVGLASASARADTFTFSFTNVYGNVAGVAPVTGEIVLPNNCAISCAATSVIITSFPLGLDSAVGPAPINATDWIFQDENSFTVSNGQVTAASFLYSEDNNSLHIDDADGINYLSLNDANTVYAWGNNGLAAANIQPLVVATPEPSSLALLGIGLLGLGAGGWVLGAGYR